MNISNSADLMDISNIEVAKGYHEVTQEDIIRTGGITADNIQVLGLKLEDSSQDMLDILGEPDIINEFDDGMTYICEYNQAIGLESTGIIVKVTDDIVERITVLLPFEPYLANGTDFVNMTKYDIYNIMHIPDTQYEEPKTRIFFYDETGIDILLDRKKVKGFSIRMPKKEHSSFQPGL